MPIHSHTHIGPCISMSNTRTRVVASRDCTTARRRSVHRVTWGCAGSIHAQVSTTPGIGGEPSIMSLATVDRSRARPVSLLEMSSQGMPACQRQRSRGQRHVSAVCLGQENCLDRKGPLSAFYVAECLLVMTRCRRTHSLCRPPET